MIHAAPTIRRHGRFNPAPIVQLNCVFRLVEQVLCSAHAVVVISTRRLKGVEIMTKIKFTDQSPDLRIPIDASDLEPGLKEVQIFVHPKAQTQVINFLKTSQLEQGGLLLGRIWSHPSSPETVARVEVIEAVPSQQSLSSAYSLQMNSTVWSSAHESLSRLNRELGTGEQELRIVGWFHSHPNIGAFFSATDVATQRAFFNQPYSLGWVIDPYTEGQPRHEAFFLGATCRPIQRASQ
jgi:JAB1/Mov34/MPN/PAD-1 ubiquitin protease